jgi:hypothetical protein
LTTLIQFGNAQRYPELEAKIVDLQPQDNRLTFSYNHAALDRLAAEAPARQSTSKYRWTKESTYRLYEGSQEIATMTEDADGKIYIDIDTDQYSVEAWTDEVNYKKPRTVFSLFFEGKRITKPARHQLLTALYRAYIGEDEAEEEGDEAETEE